MKLKGTACHGKTSADLVPCPGHVFAFRWAVFRAAEAQTGAFPSILGQLYMGINLPRTSLLLLWKPVSTAARSEVSDESPL